MPFLLAILVLGAIMLVIFFTSMNKPLAATPEEARSRGRQLLEVLESGEGQDLDMAWALLQTSPDLGLLNEQGQSALDLAVLAGDEQIVRKLQSLGAGRSPIDAESKA